MFYYLFCFTRLADGLLAFVCCPFCSLVLDLRSLYACFSCCDSYFFGCLVGGQRTNGCCRAVATAALPLRNAVPKSETRKKEQWWQGPRLSGIVHFLVDCFYSAFVSIFSFPAHLVSLCFAGTVSTIFSTRPALYWVTQPPPFLCAIHLSRHLTTTTTRRKQKTEKKEHHTTKQQGATRGHDDRIGLVRRLISSLPDTFILNPSHPTWFSFHTPTGSGCPCIAFYCSLDGYHVSTGLIQG